MLPQRLCAPRVFASNEWSRPMNGFRTMASSRGYRYAASAFDFRAVLVYDRFGLVLDYPGIAVRVA
jgi:hypothetical protein